MAKKATRYLIETSAVRPALKASTSAHNAHFTEKVKGGELWTSYYIRKEFIQRWICDALRAAFTIAQSTSVSDALILIEQDFSIRNVKGLVAVIAAYLKDTGSLKNSRRAAEEFASAAIAWLRQFDGTFSRKINNACHCKIGPAMPAIDYDRLLITAHAFYEIFKTPVKDCEVNLFLRLDMAKGRTKPLRQDPKASKLSSVVNLEEFAQASKWITCKECAKIGDSVIALEQPSSLSLVHVDGAFNELCRCLGRDHVPLDSPTKAEKDRSSASAETENAQAD